jgi:peptidoglycan/xylan/chitin deacetylase (PgdA/CDA1 family)
MVEEIRNLVRLTDKMVANLYLAVRQERGALLCFLFHSLFANQQEIDQNVVNPLQRTTVSDFRQFIEYYLQNGYRFISLDDLLGGLDADGKYALITFDDGYFSNMLARPVLEEFGVPAIFFISTDNVREQKSFWWDVLYRERMAQNASRGEIYREGLTLKKQRTYQIEEYLRKTFGEGSLKPRGDIDRAFSAEELREFARSPMVSLGNHTANHEILTNCTRDEMKEQIATAQQWLAEQTSKPVVSIAYPDGGIDQTVLDVCRELGFRAGFNVEPKKNLLPIADSSAMLQLNRFATHDKDSIPSQCRVYRSDVLIYNTFRDAYLRLAGRRALR